MPNKDVTPVSLKRSQLKLTQASLAIGKDSAKATKSLGFFPRDYLVTGLPYSQSDKLHHAYQVNSHHLVMQGHINYGLPFGQIPRLILAYIASEVKKSKARHIELPKISAFCKQFNMTATGGETGSITQLKKQLLSLFNTSFSFTYNYNWRYKGFNFFLIERYQLWSKKTENNQKDWESFIELSEPFYTQIIEHGIPFDFRALLAFKRSPMCMDIYLWLTYRLNVIKKDLLIPWASLKQQFGQGYAEDAQGRFAFQKSFKKHAENILKIYYEANIQCRKEGLLLQKSLTHVS